MERIKVLLANRPRVLREFLEDLLQHQRDIEVVGTVLDPVEILVAVDETQANVVVVTLPDSGEMPGICSHLLAEFSQLLILALSRDRKIAVLYKQSISTELFPNISDDEILVAIRKAKADIEP